MNVLERTAIKVAWSRVKGNPMLKRWLPLIGSAVVLSTVVLRAFHQPGLADAVDGLANMLGLTKVSIIDPVLITSAATGLVGIALKIKSEISKARG